MALYEDNFYKAEVKKFNPKLQETTILFPNFEEKELLVYPTSEVYDRKFWENGDYG